MNHLLALGTVWSLFVATLSVGFAVFSHWRQVNASVYLDLTKQLHELYKRIPSRRTPHDALPLNQAATEALVLDSLHLMQAAYTLSRAGYFSGRLWTALRNDAERALRRPVFEAEWPNLKDEFMNDPAFVAYVEKVQKRAVPR